MADHFVPSAASGRASRFAMHARLFESLNHVLDRCADYVPVDSARRAQFLARLTCGERVAPVVFGGFFDLVQRIEAGSLEEVGASVKALLNLDPSDAAALKVRPLDRRHFTIAEERAFRHQFVSESLRDEQIALLDEQAANTATQSIDRALALLRNHAPATYEEISCVVSEIVPAEGIVCDGRAFGGCSSLERWGTILLNATYIKSDDLVVAESIVHEAAHTVLFGKSPVNFLVENEDDERFCSPLRIDPRPMNGIYHATFVLARMHFAMREVAASPSATDVIRRQARGLCEASARLFWDGYRVVAAHARFTPEGRAIMADTCTWMQEHAPEATGVC